VAVERGSIYGQYFLRGDQLGVSAMAEVLSNKVDLSVGVGVDIAFEWIAERFLG